MVVYLIRTRVHTSQLLPEDRLAELMADLFAVARVPATVARMGRSRARRLIEGVVEVIRDLREIGTGQAHGRDRLAGRRADPMAARRLECRADLYRVSAGRGSLLDGVAGIVKCRPSYGNTTTGMRSWRTSRCRWTMAVPARHLRELQALIEIEKEGWARWMQRLLRRACQRGKPRPGAGRGAATEPQKGRRLHRRWWDAITAEGIRFHEAQPPLGPAAGRAKPGQAWFEAAPYEGGSPPPSPTSSVAQGRRASLPRQPRRALHQQSGRAGRAHGEAQAENLRRLPIHGTRGERLRDHPRLHPRPPNSKD